MVTDILPLTARQRAVYAALCVFIKAHGWPPTTRELIALTPYASTSSVRYALRQLEARGLVQVGDGARQLAVVGARWEMPNEEGE